MRHLALKTISPMGRALKIHPQLSLIFHPPAVSLSLLTCLVQSAFLHRLPGFSISIDVYSRFLSLFHLALFLLYVLTSLIAYTHTLVPGASYARDVVPYLACSHTIWIPASIRIFDAPALRLILSANACSTRCNLFYRGGR